MADMRKVQKSRKQQQSKKGRPRSAGKRNGKFTLFFAQMEEKRLRRILKRNGAEAAKAYVQEGGSSALLRKIAKEGTFAGDIAREVLGN